MNEQRKTPPANMRTAQSRALTATNERAPAEQSISQNRRPVKRRKSRRVAIVLIVAILLIVVGAKLTSLGLDGGKPDVIDATAAETSGTSSSAEETETQVPTYYFAFGETGWPVDMEQMTTAWAREAGFEKRYDITDEERYELAQVVTAEAGGEPFAGKVAVAQCILQAAEDDGIRPPKVFAKYGYTRARPEPTQESIEAVSAVFDFGYTATKEPIKYFYNPDIVASAFHESQIYVMTINNHRFFKEAKR